MDSTQAEQGRAPAPSDSLLPERYRVISQLAVGGMASVWLAEDTLLRRNVAIKVLAEQLASQPQFVERFEREARTAGALSAHPNVITIYDVGEHAGRPFIVMAHLPGGTVRDRLESGRVERGDAVRWLTDAAAALDFAHAHGVVHRDVKPHNLLFDGEGRVVVADLGIARAAYEERLTASGELLGTASYISPEQAIGEPATPASDRYSLAVVAYQLLTGALPFGGPGTFAEQALRQVEAEPEPPSSRAPELWPEVDAVLLRGLDKDPHRRWESAAAFVSALRGALDQLASPERTRTWPASAPVGGSRRPRLQAAAVAALLAAALGAGGVALLSARDGGGDGAGEEGGRASRSGEPSDRAAPSPAKPRSTERGEEAPAPVAPPAAEPSPSVPAGASPATLNERGFALMNQGRYDQAIPFLRRAVAAYPTGSTDLTYAYALYNLGRSLRLAGRPAEAIPYLERRLRIDNQRGVVRRELAAARAASA